MKKKNLLLSLIIVSGLSAFAQQNSSAPQIPANVSDKLHALYPAATNVTWQQDQGFYIPVFTVNNVTTKLLIDPKGAWVQTSSKITSSALPATVSSYVAANYAGQAITDTEKLTMINNSTRYEVVVGGKDLIFNGTGAFLKKVTGPLKQ